MTEIPVVGNVKDKELARGLRAAYEAGARLLSLVAEPNNPHHARAIAVYLHRGRQAWKVGYLPREVADVLRGDPYQARLVGWYWVGSHDWPGLRLKLNNPAVVRAIRKAREKGRPWAQPPKAAKPPAQARPRQRILF